MNASSQSQASRQADQAGNEQRRTGEALDRRTRCKAPAHRTRWTNVGDPFATDDDDSVDDGRSTGRGNDRCAANDDDDRCRR